MIHFKHAHAHALVLKCHVIQMVSMVLIMKETFQIYKNMNLSKSDLLNTTSVYSGHIIELTFAMNQFHPNYSQDDSFKSVSSKHFKFSNTPQFGTFYLSFVC